MKKPAYKKGLAFFIVSTLLLWGACILILFGEKASAPSCKEEYRNDITVKIDNKTLKTQVAESATEREKGLSGKKCIQADTAMLFKFDKSGYYPFWMKDMKFPVDIIWVDSDRGVVAMKENVGPETYPKNFSNSKPAQYVLEVKAGNIKTLRIQEGTRVNF